MLTAVDSTKLMPPLPDEVKDGQWMGVTVRSQKPGGKVMVRALCSFWQNFCLYNCERERGKNNLGFEVEPKVYYESFSSLLKLGHSRILKNR